MWPSITSLLPATSSPPFPFPTHTLLWLHRIPPPSVVRYGPLCVQWRAVSVILLLFSDPALVRVRETWHKALCLPLDMPMLRITNTHCFTSHSREGEQRLPLMVCLMSQLLCPTPIPCRSTAALSPYRTYTLPPRHCCYGSRGVCILPLHARQLQRHCNPLTLPLTSLNLHLSLTLTLV